MRINKTTYDERVQRGERNDCTVRALAAAAGLTYDEAHDMLARAGRQARRGCPLEIIKRVYSEAGGGGYISRSDRPTLAAFMRQHGPGKYVVLVSRHVFALIDDVQYDMNANGARKRVWGYWKFN